MVKGFILITTLPEKEHEVYNRLRKVKEITNVRPLFGEYDLLAEVEAKGFDELETIIEKKITKLEGVIKTRLRK